MSTELHWFKSSYSGGGGDNCVEVAHRTTAVHVRDSKNPHIRPFTVGRAAWSAFTRAAAAHGAE
jgi:Domain of unknown function (DUF397)